LVEFSIIFKIYPYTVIPEEECGFASELFLFYFARAEELERALNILLRRNQMVLTLDNI